MSKGGLSKNAPEFIPEFVTELKAVGVYKDVEKICARNGFSDVTQLWLPNRLPHISRARYMVFTYFKLRFDWSLPAIGGLMNRDHTTVLAGLRTCREEDVEWVKKLVDNTKGKDDDDHV